MPTILLGWEKKSKHKKRTSFLQLLIKTKEYSNIIDEEGKNLKMTKNGPHGPSKVRTFKPKTTLITTKNRKHWWKNIFFISQA